MLSIQYFFIFYSDLSIFGQFSSKFVIRKIGFFFFQKKKFRVGPEFLGSVGEPETQLFVYVILSFPPLDYQPERADNLKSCILNGEKLSPACDVIAPWKL